MISLATNVSSAPPAVKLLTFRALSSMSRKNSSQLRDTDRLGFDDRPRPILEGAFHDQVHAPPQLLLEAPLQAHVLRQPWRLAKLDQHVDVAVGTRLVPRNGAEQSQRGDSELPFQFGAVTRE